MLSQPRYDLLNRRFDCSTTQHGYQQVFVPIRVDLIAVMQLLEVFEGRARTLVRDQGAEVQILSPRPFIFSGLQRF